MTRQVNLRLSDDLYERVEAARGEVPRERWLRRAVEQALDGPVPRDYSSSITAEDAGAVDEIKRTVPRRPSYVRHGSGPIPKGK